MGDSEIASLMARLGLTPAGEGTVPGLSGIQDLGDRVRMARKHPKFAELALRRERNEISPETFMEGLKELAP